jgi:AraC-like DNA-binding protein
MSDRPKAKEDQVSRAHKVTGFDVLGDVLGGLGLRTRVFCHLEVSAPWSVTIGETDLAHFHVVQRGGCWLERAKGPPRALASGDLVVVQRGGPYQLADRPGRKGTPLDRLFPASPAGRCTLVRHGGDGATSLLVCGSFSFEHPDSHPVLPLLPDVLHLQAGEETSEWLESLPRFLAAEALANRPGSATILSRLTDVLFVQVVRAWLSTQPDEPSWLRALNDPRLARALAALHEDPGRDWSVGNLAAHAAMSRSPFSSRFTSVVGEPPYAYVARVRMERAARMLREGRKTLAEVAAAVGYESESSFSRVFKRHFRASPGIFRQKARSSVEEPA